MRTYFRLRALDMLQRPLDLVTPREPEGTAALARQAKLATGPFLILLHQATGHPPHHAPPLFKRRRPLCHELIELLIRIFCKLLAERRILFQDNRYVGAVLVDVV
jgi:hypothetical protein